MENSHRMGAGSDGAAGRAMPSRRSVLALGLGVVAVGACLASPAAANSKTFTLDTRGGAAYV